MLLNQLRPARGAKKRPKRVGRGIGSGHGKTATKGHKGFLARSGGGKKASFEGGQMPLVQRIPKRGFRNPFRVVYSIVNLKDLIRLEGKDVVTPEILETAGLIKSKDNRIKILGDGEVTRPLTIQAHKFSQSAVDKIKKAKGKTEVLLSTGRASGKSS